MKDTQVYKEYVQKNFFKDDIYEKSEPMKNHKDFIGGKKLTIYQLLDRILILESIVEDMRESLTFYADKGSDNGELAKQTFIQYNKSWEEIYKEREGLFEEIQKSVPLPEPYNF